MRKEALAIGAEMRSAKRARIEAPTICAALRDKIGSLYRAIQRARKEIRTLTSDYGRESGFQE